jgi:hypothetical protein
VVLAVATAALAAGGSLARVDASDGRDRPVIALGIEIELPIPLPPLSLPPLGELLGR